MFCSSCMMKLFSMSNSPPTNWKKEKNVLLYIHVARNHVIDDIKKNVFGGHPVAQCLMFFCIVLCFLGIK